MMAITNIINVPCKRCLAFLIDMIIVNLIFIQPLMINVQNMLPEDIVELSFAELREVIESNAALAQQLNNLSILAIVLVLAYFILLEYIAHRTIGQYILRLRVVAYAHTLSLRLDKKKLVKPLALKPLLLQVIIRNICLVPLFPFILLWFIEPVWLFWKKTTLLDYYTNTAVVEVERKNGKV